MQMEKDIVMPVVVKERKDASTRRSHSNRCLQDLCLATAVQYKLRGMQERAGAAGTAGAACTAGAAGTGGAAGTAGTVLTSSLQLRKAWIANHISRLTEQLPGQVCLS